MTTRNTPEQTIKFSVSPNRKHIILSLGLLEDDDTDDWNLSIQTAQRLQTALTYSIHQSIENQPYGPKKLI